MVDVFASEDAKLTVRMYAYLAQKALKKIAKGYGAEVPTGKTILDVIHDDLRNNQNPVMRQVYKELLKTGSKIPNHHQASNIVDLGAFALWVIIKDTSYRDPFFYTLQNIIDNKDIRESLQNYVNNPEDWYTQLFNDAKKETEKKRKDGVIGDNYISQEEAIFLPNKLKDVEAEAEKELLHKKRVLRM